MKTLLMLQGLPASGKTTYARELVASGHWTRVNKDDLRDQFHNGKWSKGNEKIILASRDTIISLLLTLGHNVVVDDTNLHRKHITRLQELAKAHEAHFEANFFEVTVEEAIKRDLARDRSVGEEVIRRMYNDFIRPEVTPYSAPGFPEAVIYDVDGSLANHSGIRGPYETSKYHLDTPNKIICDLAASHKAAGKFVIIVSGRDEAFREVTEAWFAQHGIEFDLFFMRPKDDKRPDTEIKLEIFETHIRDRFDVLFVIDDRKRVIRAWQSIGLKVLAFTQSIDDDF